MKNKYSIKVIFIVLLSILSIFFVGFKLTTNKTPNELYAVYLEGKKIGVVKSKDVRYWISISLIDHGYYKCAKKYIEEPFIKEIENLKKKNTELQQKIDTLSF